MPDWTIVVDLEPDDVARNVIFGRGVTLDGTGGPAPDEDGDTIHRGRE